LLEKGVDGDTDFGIVRGFGVLTVSNVEGVESHGGLFCGTFVRDSDVFRVVRDALQHAESDGLIVLHGGKAVRNLLRERGSGQGRVGDDGAIGIELAHLGGNGEHVPIEFLRGSGIDLFCEVAKDGVARRVPAGVSGAAPFVAMLLPPTVFCRTERMVAGEAGKFGILGPEILLVGAPRQPVHRCT